MEKKKIGFSDIKSMLTRDQMKQIKGGSGGGNPNCAGDTGTSQWYCCTGPGTATDSGNTTCEIASQNCHTKLTNSKSLCY